MWYWVTACASLFDPYEVISKNQENLLQDTGEKFEVNRARLEKKAIFNFKYEASKES